MTEEIGQELILVPYFHLRKATINMENLANIRVSDKVGDGDSKRIRTIYTVV